MELLSWFEAVSAASSHLVLHSTKTSPTAAGGADAPDGSAAAPAAAGNDGAAAATVAEQRADALHSIVDQLTETEAELLAELLATRTAQAWDPGVASRAEAGLA